MKGFTKDGKFHPITDYKGVRKKRLDYNDPELIQNAGVKIIKDDSGRNIRMKRRADGSRIKKLEFKVWKFEDAPDDLKEKIIEKLRDSKYEFGDDWFADYDGIIYDKKTNIGDYDVFENYSKKYYDLDRGQFIQFPDLVVKDEKKLAKMIGIPESLRKKIDFRFVSEDERNTKLIFIDAGYNYNEIDLEESYDTYKEPMYADEHYRSEDKPMTKKEFNILIKASENWDDLMHSAWSGLRDNYEYQFTDEALKEDAISNEYEFDEEGNIA